MSDDNNAPKIDIDLSYLSDVANGSTEFIIDMIDIFIDQTPLYVKQLGLAIQEKNWKTVADISHKIKPTLAFMGVIKARDDMEEIESNARSLENLDEIQSKFNDLEIICNHLFVRLQQLKKELQTKL
ncbi:MAG TPA: Hpt domain-containing protein [Sphingobacteriaceae bacterium]|nr:Hpt domain-containing protein [Sphingobacteriaceae bacterium]